MEAMGWRGELPGRILASFGFSRGNMATNPVFFSLRIDNYRHIDLAFGKEAAEAVHADLCTLAGDLFGAGPFVGGTVHARDTRSIDIVAWKSAAATVVHPFMLETLCEGLSLTSFVWKGHALHVALSVASASARGDEATSPQREVWETLDRTVASGEPVESGAGWLRQYRRDMEDGGRLLRKLDADEICFAWQPIVDVTHRDSVLYYEALARAPDQEGRLNTHQDELLALERLGLVRAFDHRIFSLVLDELEADPFVRLGVNISARSAILDAWWERSLARLAADRSLAARLVIEITETAPLRPISDVTAFMSEMRRLGCRFALDDFGVGHASFRQLLSLSPDIVKIASAFLHTELSELRRTTLAHLKGLAETLATVVVVEGVETGEQSRLAQAVGLTWQQGYFMGSPSCLRPWRESLSVAPGGASSLSEIRNRHSARGEIS